METNLMEPAREYAAEIFSPAMNRPRRILVLENDRDVRRLDTEVLKRWGYSVDAADTGTAAWEALQAERYDLMIADHAMTEQSGVGLLRKLRCARLGLPVIVATDNTPKDNLALYPWLQPAITLLKPYTCMELVQTVKVLLRAADKARKRTARPTRYASPDDALRAYIARAHGHEVQA